MTNFYSYGIKKYAKVTILWCSKVGIKILKLVLSTNKNSRVRIKILNYLYIYSLLDLDKLYVNTDFYKGGLLVSTRILLQGSQKYLK